MSIPFIPKERKSARLARRYAIPPDRCNSHIACSHATAPPRGASRALIQQAADLFDAERRVDALEVYEKRTKAPLVAQPRRVVAAIRSLLAQLSKAAN